MKTVESDTWAAQQKQATPVLLTSLDDMFSFENSFSFVDNSIVNTSGQTIHSGVLLNNPDDSYNLVTSINQLSTGNEVIVIGRKPAVFGLYVMYTQSGDRRPTTTLPGWYGSAPSVLYRNEFNNHTKFLITKSGNEISFYDEVYPGFLYTDRNPKRNLRTSIALNINSKWRVTVDSSGESKLKNSANGREIAYDRNYLGQPFFTADTSDESPFYIYKKTINNLAQTVENPFEDLVYEIGTTPVTISPVKTDQNSLIKFVSSDNSIVEVVNNRLVMKKIGKVTIVATARSVVGYTPFYKTFSVEVVPKELTNVIATEASVIYYNRFTANWLKNIKTNSYQLSVYKKEPSNFSNNLFISEYGEGSGYFKKYIEITNFTGETVDLENYKIVRASNGGAWTDGDTFAVNFNGRTLPHGKTLVIAHNSSDVNVSSAEHVIISSLINMNGNDGIGLEWNGGRGNQFFLIDAVGEANNDPGVGWSVAGIANATKDRILIRKPSVYQGNINWDSSRGTTAENSEWTVSSFTYNNTNQTANLGIHNFGHVGLRPVYVLKDFAVNLKTNQLVNNSLGVENEIVDETDYFYTIRSVYQNQRTSHSNEIALKTNKLSIWSNDLWSKGQPIDFLTDALVISSYPNNVIGEGGFIANSIMINENVNLTIPKDKYISVQHELEMHESSTLKFEDGAYFIQKNPAITNTATMHFERKANFYKFDTKMWSSPVMNQKIRKQTQQDVKGFIYNPSGVFVFNDLDTKWVNTSDIYFQPAVGYGLQVVSGYHNYPSGGDSVNFTGNFIGIPYNGTVRVPVIKLLNGYNNIGNPYGSPISIDELIDHNLIRNPEQINIESVHFWNEKAHYAVPGGYQTQYWNVYNRTGGNTSPSQQVMVSAGVGFVVKVANSGRLEFTNAMRFIPNAQTSVIHKPKKNRHRYWLKLSYENRLQNQLLIGYVEGATNNHDEMFDAESISLIGSHILSSSNNRKYIIEGRALPFSKNDRVSLYFKSNEAGRYVFELAAVEGIFNENQAIFLIDHQEKKIVSLKNAKAYSFYSEKGQFEKRFELAYENRSLQFINDDSMSIQVVASKQQISVHSSSTIDSYQLVNLLGHTLLSKKQLNQKAFSIRVNTIKGVFFLQLKTVDGEISVHKLILK